MTNVRVSGRDAFGHRITETVRIPEPVDWAEGEAEKLEALRAAGSGYRVRRIGALLYVEPWNGLIVSAAEPK